MVLCRIRFPQPSQLVGILLVSRSRFRDVPSVDKALRNQQIHLVFRKAEVVTAFHVMVSIPGAAVRDS
ncbi:hypothetical protein A5745_16800 [Mycobacterium sp. IS-2888]|nr:hypothetical protein A5745_16800 [Mycobacterium sp. IS-2888]